MNTPEGIPYRSPEEAKEPATMPEGSGADPKLSRAAKIVLGCLVFHFIGWQILCYRHHSVILELMIGCGMLFSSPVGFGFSVPAIRRRGFANHVLGLLGLLWFGYYIFLSITGC
jgi:hypothetical protein